MDKREKLLEVKKVLDIGNFYGFRIHGPDAILFGTMNKLPCKRRVLPPL